MQLGKKLGKRLSNKLNTTVSNWENKISDVTTFIQINQCKTHNQNLDKKLKTLIKNIWSSECHCS